MGGGTSDAYEMARHVWWFKHALQTGQDPYWQSNLGYPDGFSGVSLQANPLQFFPMWLFAFVMPVALAYNLTIWLTMALNGWAMAVLMHYLLSLLPQTTTLANRLAALLAGVVFMAFPTFQGHLADGHAGLMVMWPVPLYVYALFQLIAAQRLRQGGGRWLGLSVLCFLLSPAGHMLQVFYVLVPVTGLFLLARLSVRDWRGAGRIILMGLISSVLLLLYLLPVIVDTLNSPVYADTGGYVRYSADVLGIVSPSFLHPLWGAVLDYPRRVLGINLGEGSTYIGLFVGLLVLIAAWRVRAARWWLLLALVTWVLSLGPLLKVFDQPLQVAFGDYQSYIVMPYAGLYDLPVINWLRAPGRFTFTLALAVAALAGYGMMVILQPLNSQRIGRAGALWAIVVALIVFDYQFFWPMPTVTAMVPDAVHDLRTRDDIDAVFNVPYEHLLAAKDALYLQTAHQKALIGGQVTRQTPVNPAKLRLLQETLDPVLLNQAGADVVVFHKQRAQEIDQLDALQARFDAQYDAPFYADERIALYAVPPTNEQDTPSQAIYAPSGRTNDTYNAAIYQHDPMWLQTVWQLEADNRIVNVVWNNAVVQRLTLNGRQDVTLALPSADVAAYNRLQFTLEPPCPLHFDPTLACRDLTVHGVDVTTITPINDVPHVRYVNGVDLLASDVQHAADTLTVRLWWQFDQARAETDLRFVHVVDADGQIARRGEMTVQSDVALGAFAAGSQWVEMVTLPLDGLPVGSYRVQVGWYDYPGLNRFAVMASNFPYQDEAVQIGTVTVNR